MGEKVEKQSSMERDHQYSERNIRNQWPNPSIFQIGKLGPKVVLLKILQPDWHTQS